MLRPSLHLPDRAAWNGDVDSDISLRSRPHASVTAVRVGQELGSVDGGDVQELGLKRVRSVWCMVRHSFAVAADAEVVAGVDSGKIYVCTTMFR